MLVADAGYACRFPKPWNAFPIREISCPWPASMWASARNPSLFNS